MSSQENPITTTETSTLRQWLIAGGVVIAITGGYAFFSSQHSKVDQEAQNALFKAETAYEAELKVLLPSPKPVPSVAPEAADKKGAKAKPAPVAKDEGKETVEDIEFKKLDVNTVFAKAVAGFQSVAQNYSSSRAGFDARLKLAQIYAQHGGDAEAARWFAEAAKAAPDSFEKSAALLGEAHSLENQKNYKDALDRVNGAFKLGELAFKPEVLLSQGRLSEALGKSAEAAKAYEEVLSQFPNSQAAKYAEAFKAKLPR